MRGTDYAQTRFAAIEALSARAAKLQENSPAHFNSDFPGAASQLAEMKREAKIFLLDGGHPGSPWNAKLAEIVNGT